MKNSEEKQQPTDFVVEGFSKEAPEAETAVCRSRILGAVTDFLRQTGSRSLSLRISVGNGVGEGASAGSARGEEESLEGRALRFSATEPLWGMSRLVIPDTLRSELETAIETVRLEPQVFDAWGLREIEPFPRAALNFHGPPGTGKTMAAHAVAAALGKRILCASYAAVESKYHGDGPKNVEALFHAARRDDAVLFLDEADSLLSRRLTNVTQGSEQAINSMRSQILICLERHKGVVIFATNLVENYDQAFETLVRHIRFPLPDRKALVAIWKQHLPAALPLEADVDLTTLADLSQGLCGRDIKNAVVHAALGAAREGSPAVGLHHLSGSISSLQQMREDLAKPQGGEEQAKIVSLLQGGQHRK